MSMCLWTLEELGFSFAHKVLFQPISAKIYVGRRIAIIGPNGSGKSTLMKILQGDLQPTSGILQKHWEAEIAMVPQLITDFAESSGGERFNKALSHVLELQPDVLFLDEPTNHLDEVNRKGLFKMLQHFTGTQIIATHDVALLRSWPDEIWCFENGKMETYHGTYDNLRRDRDARREALHRELSVLRREKKELHQKAMEAQKQAVKSREKGQKKYRNDPFVKFNDLERSGQGKLHGLKTKWEKRKEAIREEVQELYIEEVHPKFHFTSKMGKKDAPIVIVSEGICGYNIPVLENISLYLHEGERLALQGKNGSGKTTLVKALLGDPEVKRSGLWTTPSRDAMGYLDQHYGNLDPKKSVLTTIADRVPQWTYVEVRKHLNDFLFRKNHEVEAFTSSLSGGERVRLSLALIAAQTPRLLILDEVSNNLDLQTSEHLIQVLNAYPGTLLVISHDAFFLERIGVAIKNIEKI